jgi:hypothetical protein
MSCTSWPKAAGTAVPVLLLLSFAVTAAPAAAQGFEMRGVVSSATNGSALQYAVVGVPELSEWDLTDEQGAFSLDIPERGTYRLIVLRRGYYLVDASVYLEPTGDAPIEILAELEEEQPDNPLSPGRLIGTVIDQENGRPIQDAEVTIQPTGQTAVTDRRGNFDIPEISGGAIAVEITRVGYQNRTDTLASFPGVNLAVEFSMAPEAIELNPIVVSVRSHWLESVGFYRRQQQGIGNHWDRAAIEELRPVVLSDVFRRRPAAGVRVDRGSWGETVLTSTRGRGCEMSTWLDEVRMPGFDIDTYPWEAVAAMEVYRGSQVPARFPDQCGVLLIWSVRN